MSKNSPIPVWYAEGLSFTCTGCGKCCTGSPGAVWISQKEIESVATFLSISVAEFEHLYVRSLNGKKALIEKPPKKGQYDCIFLQGNRCQIYPCRPKQCKTFPWWPENLSSPQTWKETARYCEGINHQDAPLISEEEIQKHL